MKKYLFLFILILSVGQLSAGILDSLSIGVGGGYESYNTFRGEIYLKSDIQMFNRKAELKAGLNNRSFRLDFDNIEELDAKAIGLFADATVYPFNKGLFTGLRWELINFNRFTTDSKSKIEAEKDYPAPSLFTGTCLFFQLGYNFKVSDNFGLKLYGQPGFQQFKISNGDFTSGNYSQGSSNDNLITEDHYKFIFNINLSIEFRIK